MAQATGVAGKAISPIAPIALAPLEKELEMSDIAGNFYDPQTSLLNENYLRFRIKTLPIGLTDIQKTNQLTKELLPLMQDKWDSEGVLFTAGYKKTLASKVRQQISDAVRIKIVPKISPMPGKQLEMPARQIPIEGQPSKGYEGEFAEIKPTKVDSQMEQFAQNLVQMSRSGINSQLFQEQKQLLKSSAVIGIAESLLDQYPLLKKRIPAVTFNLIKETIEKVFNKKLNDDQLDFIYEALAENWPKLSK